MSDEILEGVDPTPSVEENPVVETETENEEEENLIELADGSKVAIEELKNGYLRQSDYTKKTQSVAEERAKLNEELANLGKAKMEEVKPVDGKPKYNPEELEKFKGLMSELGYVNKDELTQHEQKKTETSIINAFMSKHPEYAAENDPGDHKITKLKRELALYNTSDLKNLPLVLERAHKTVAGEVSVEKKAGAELAAVEKVKSATLGSQGGGMGAVPPSQRTLTPAQIQTMKDMGVYDETKHGK